MMSSFKILFAWVILAFIGVTAQAQGVTANFPQPAQVNADYPDAAERFAAFTILYDAFVRTAPKPLSTADYATQFSYQASSNMVATQEMGKDGAGTQALRDFNTRCNQLISDSTFTHAVFDKYQLGGIGARASRPPPAIVDNPVVVAPRPAPAPVAVNPAPAKPTGLIDTLLNKPIIPMSQHTYSIWLGLAQMSGLIFIVAMLVFFGACSAAMAVAAWLVLRRSGAGRKVYPVPAPMPGGLPALPQNLQVVSVPGVRYAVYVLSGLVLENKSVTHTRTFTTVTGGGTIQTITGQTVTGLPQTHYHTSTSVEDIIWIRQPNGMDNQLSIFDGNFQCRAGHLISVLVRQGKDGGYILLAYNHSMGALSQCPALDDSHEPSGNELGQWAANIAGGIAAWYMMKIVWNSTDETGIIAGFAVFWLIAWFLLVCISFFIVTPLVKWRIRRQRNGRFKLKYLTGYRQFFEQGTPLLRRTYGG